jgi:hypothetical protein
VKSLLKGDVTMLAEKDRIFTNLYGYQTGA